MNKAEMRMALRAKRTHIVNQGEKNDAITRKLQTMAVLEQAATVGYYVAHEAEVKLNRPLRATVAYPYITGGDMIFMANNDGFMPTAVGIMAPVAGPESKDVVPEVLLVPVIAVNKAGYRLGYGGGFYDRYLAAHPDVIAIALAYEEQIIEDAFEDVWDVPMQLVVTDKRIYKL